MTFIRFPSHRARDYAMQELTKVNEPRPLAYYSFKRDVGKGIYKVSDAQLKCLDESSSRHVRFTRLRGPFDDLGKCWD